MKNQTFEVMFNFKNIYFEAKYKVKYKMKFNMSMKNYDYRTQNVRFGAVLKIYTFMQNLSYGASAILACEIFDCY